MRRIIFSMEALVGRIYKLPLLLEPAEEGGWFVRSPVIPELITEIDHLDENDEKLKDALAAVKELYEDMDSFWGWAG